MRADVAGKTLVLLLGLLLAACTSPGLDRQARKLGFDAPTRVAGAPFQHRLVYAPGVGRVLHVYIEGDGRPWIGEDRIATDPSPERALMLELMATDVAPRLFLGRPCYFGIDDTHCDPRWWTDARYSEAVVASMNVALDSVAGGYDGLVLLGHSGGGTLAMLLAGRRQDVLAVVTLAGNLDIASWAQWHDYTPLRGSLNPATQPPLDAAVTQWHYLGAGDEKILPAMVQEAVARQPAASFYLLPGTDHSCCWAQWWPRVLQSLPAAP